MTTAPEPSDSSPARSRMRRARLVAFIIVPVILVATFAVFAVQTFASRQVCETVMPDAETTTATVATPIERYSVGSGSDRETRFGVNYRYEVDGVDYRTRGRDFGNSGRANDFAEEHPTATVHYDPAQPLVSCVSFE